MGVGFSESKAFCHYQLVHCFLRAVQDVSSQHPVPAVLPATAAMLHLMAWTLSNLWNREPQETCPPVSSLGHDVLSQ